MSRKITIKYIYFYILTLFISGSFVLPAFASITDGTIDATYKYAWSENVGWLNFGATEGNVHITDSSLTGYAWSPKIGWISLNCSNTNSCADLDYKVSNDGQGTLSGYAWSENAGWINFSPTYGGVTINSSGEFLGYAYGPKIGWIVFNCATTDSCSTVDYKVKTDWRPRSARPACNNSTDDDGDGKIDYPADLGCSSLDDNDETDPVPYPGGGVYIPPAPPKEEKPPLEEEKPAIVKRIREGFKEISEKASEIVKRIAELLKPKPPEVKPPEVPIEELVPKEAPLAFQGKWQLLPSKPIKEFVLSPLPKEIRKLAEKFPELGKTLKKVGITKITDIGKLKTVKLTLPGLTERVGLPTAKIEPGKFALPQGVPIVELSPEIKKAIPSEIVFAKTGGELIDFNIALSVSEKGEAQQKITTISGKLLQLVIKPEKPVKSVKGYVVFKSKTPRPTSFQFPFNYLTASLIFTNPVFAKTQDKPVRVEEKLVLLEFEYTDPDGDGIYTAEILTPIVEGEYEIITVMDFEDPELGKKEIRLITVVDPEGYIYTQLPEGKLRITGAIISLYWLNTETKQYELWPAKEYQQENPQITDDTGKYSFLVPPGTYYLRVEAPKYPVYQSETFSVKEGIGIHMNIELKTKYWWLKIIDWKIIVMIIFGALLLYNFYRDKIREKLLKKI